MEETMQTPDDLRGPAVTGRPHVLEVYRYAARKGGIETVDVVAGELGILVNEVTEAVEYLLDSRLLRADGPPVGRFVPIDPEIAAASLVSSVEREIYQRRERIDQIRERLGAFRLDTTEGDAWRPAAMPIDYLADSDEVLGFLKLARDTCRDEVLVLLSSGDDSGGLDLLDDARLCAVGRSVSVRIVCQHRNRTDLATRVRIRKLVDAGAVVRTVSYVPRTAVVFDRSLAVLFGLSGGGESGVARVNNYGVVGFLLDLFNHLWDGATPLAGVESGYENVSDDLHRTIAALMAEGYTDEVIARKLDMSVRTCRRHIAALLRDLDAISRFQAGVAAARRYFAAHAE
jgi:hypothetical protein